MRRLGLAIAAAVVRATRAPGDNPPPTNPWEKSSRQLEPVVDKHILAMLKHLLRDEQRCKSAHATISVPQLVLFCADVRVCGPVFQACTVLCAERSLDALHM